MSAHPYPGKLIAVEGLDGSGKSTQLYLLKRWLELQGLKVHLTEWNSSVVVKSATSKGKKRQLLTATTFSLIHATDFADRYEQEIFPLLKGGYIVLADRYIFTAFARDVTRGCNRDWVQNVYRFAVDPDMTFYFKVPLDIALDRVYARRPKLKYFESGMDLRLSPDIHESFRLFQDRIRSEYEWIADHFKHIVIDGTRRIEDQQQEVRDLVAGQIDLSSYLKRSATLGDSADA